MKRLVSDRNEDAEFLPAFVMCLSVFGDAQQLLELLTQKHITLMVRRIYPLARRHRCHNRNHNSHCYRCLI